MKAFIYLLLGWLCVSGQAAQPTPNASVLAHSSSGQFLVYGLPLKSNTPPALPGRIRLDPSLVAVSSERIKQVFLRELNAADQWRGKITLASQFMLDANRPVDIRSLHGSPYGRMSVTTLSPNDWHYRVELPDEIETNKYIRAITHVLLLEMANRQAADRSAELPLWLSEGMTGQILSSANFDLALQHDKQYAREKYHQDPAQFSRYWLQNHTANTFNELGIPSAETLQGEKWETFRVSSQLFVGELLKLPGGSEHLRNFLQSLPKYLNWQLAFLEAYRPVFGSLLEVEKWWALRLAQIEGEELWFGWSKPDAWNQWEEILLVNVLVSDSNTNLPASRLIPLQHAIELYDYPVQKEILNARLSQLQILRARSSPKVAPLIDGYLQTLRNYMSRRDEAGYEPAIKGMATPRPQLLVEDTIKKLNALDKRRAALRQAFLPKPAVNPPRSKPNGPVRTPKAAAS